MTALSGVVAVVLVACALFTIGYQLVDGYTNIEPLLYAKGLGLQLVSFVLMAALAVFFQVATGNMFVGYVLMIAYLVLRVRSEEHTSELQSLMRISYAVFCLKQKNYASRIISFDRH